MLYLFNIVGIGSAAGELQMIRRAAFEKVGGYREDLVTSEDNNLFYRLSREGRVRTNPKLVVLHSGRHGHVWGWPKMLFVWYTNTLSYLFRGKSITKKWEEIR